MLCVKVSCKKYSYKLSMWTGVINGIAYTRPYLADPLMLHMINVLNKVWNG